MVKSVVVVGSGTMGAWTAWHLLKLGAHVTLIDAWGPGNGQSSSGGETRIIRALYGDHHVYSRWVKESIPHWQELEEFSGQTLYHQVGALWLLGADQYYFHNGVPFFEQSGIEYEILSHNDCLSRFPILDLKGVEIICYEPNAGYLRAGRAIRLLQRRFVSDGGDYLTALAKPGTIATGSMKYVETETDRVAADAFVFACGPWLPKLFSPLLNNVLSVSRQELFFLQPPRGGDTEMYRDFPAFVDLSHGCFYGIPDCDSAGFKVGDDIRKDTFDVHEDDRIPSSAGLRVVRDYLGKRFPDLARAPLVNAQVCQYSNTVDGHLLIDRHPEAHNCWFVGGGSGHGFKLGPVLGEYVAEKVLMGGDPHSYFTLKRKDGIDNMPTQFMKSV